MRSRLIVLTMSPTVSASLRVGRQTLTLRARSSFARRREAGSSNREW
jgi:hypothetical protein